MFRLLSRYSFVGNRIDPINSNILSIVRLVLVKTVPINDDCLAKLCHQGFSFEWRNLCHNFFFQIFLDKVILDLDLVTNDHFFLDFFLLILLHLFFHLLAFFVFDMRDSLLSDCLGE